MRAIYSFGLFGALVLSTATLCADASARGEIESYAIVNDDATLQVRSKTIRLFGVHIPDSGPRKCNRHRARCASRAASALAFKIQGFVRCNPVVRHVDRTLTARCVNDGVDLSEYLISRGLALALPAAPFGFHALERIARDRGAGLWRRRSH
ncbi:MAG: nuclease-like protein [Gammaproteobacteria bacterium]|nr:nuclease-like protein [Gammaproteobacteria bacterium]